MHPIKCNSLYFNNDDIKYQLQLGVEYFDKQMGIGSTGLFQSEPLVQNIDKAWILAFREFNKRHGILEPEGLTHPDFL